MSQKQKWDECLYNDPKFVEFLEQEEWELEQERAYENEKKNISKIEELKEVAAQWAMDCFRDEIGLCEEMYPILNTILACLLCDKEE